MINNIYIGGSPRQTLDGCRGLRLVPYKVMNAKINLAKSSSTTRAFIIVSNNKFTLIALPSFLTISLSLRVPEERWYYPKIILA